MAEPEKKIVEVPNIHSVLAAMRALEETPEVKAYLALLRAVKGESH